MAQQLCTLTLKFAWVQFPHLPLFKQFNLRIINTKDLDKDLAHGKYYTKC